MQRLFQNNGRYDMTANQLSAEITALLTAAVHPYMERGYDFRDLGNIITMAAFDASVQIALDGIAAFDAEKEKERIANLLTPRQLLRKVRKLLDAGKKIDAIVLVRRNDGLGLKESKDKVDQIQTEWQQIQQMREPR